MRLSRRDILTGSLFLVAGLPPAWAHHNTCGRIDLAAFAERLFQRECGGDRRKLIWWSPHEPFPSLGIAHFIWPPAGVDVPFEAAFPAMMQWVGRHDPPPGWLRQPHAPWPDRAAFLAEDDSPRIRQARSWLWRTRTLQAAYVLHRFRTRWYQVLATQPDAALLATRLAALTTSDGGCWAVLDYASFKGLGDNPQERYQGQGWGLMQVLRAMRGHSLADFVAAAERVLQRRIALAPRDERHWWPGWQKRVRSYLEKP